MDGNERPGDGIGGCKTRDPGASKVHGPGDRRDGEVWRVEDGELLGFVRPAKGRGWLALTVFGGLLGQAAQRGDAESIVARCGLASMAQRWHWRDRRTGTWRVVVPQEARPGWVRVAVGWYSLPEVETAVITSADLAAGDELTLAPPADSAGHPVGSGA